MSQKNNNMLLFETKCSYAIARLLFTYPHKMFHLRELARETGFSTTPVITVIERFKKLGIISVFSNDVTTEIKANLSSENYRQYKISFNLYRLSQQEFAQSLIHHFHFPECITLFGSFAKGEDIEQSDIDILLISSLKEPMYKEQYTKFINSIENEFKRKVNIHLLSSLNKSEKEFRNAVANGIVLYGYLKVI